MRAAAVTAAAAAGFARLQPGRQSAAPAAWLHARQQRRRRRWRCIHLHVQNLAAVRSPPSWHRRGFRTRGPCQPMHSALYWLMLSPAHGLGRNALFICSPCSGLVRLLSAALSARVFAIMRFHFIIPEMSLLSPRVCVCFSVLCVSASRVGSAVCRSCAPGRATYRVVVQVRAFTRVGVCIGVYTLAEWRSCTLRHVSFSHCNEWRPLGFPVCPC